MAITTGMRRGEILGLRWSDVDLKNKRLSVRQILQQKRDGTAFFKGPKTQKSLRSIPLANLAIDALKRHKAAQAELRLQLGTGKDKDDLVFHNARGEPWRPNSMSGAYRDFIKARGFRAVSFHGLRHSHATHLLENNTHPKIVSERLGHSTTAITLDLYSHILPTLQETVTASIDESLKGASVTGD